MQPTLYVLAGPNGAGKSSLFTALSRIGFIPAALEFVNADVYEAAHLQHVENPEARSAAARAWADDRRTELLRTGASFVSETVFSHPSKLTLLENARAAGFFVTLLIVGVDDVQKLIARVAQRVREGGHDVPTPRLIARYGRTMTLLRSACEIADLTMLFDSESTHKRVAVLQHGRIVHAHDDAPRWAREMLPGA